MTRLGAAPTRGSGRHTWSWGGRLRRTSPALLDYCGSRVVGLVKSAITRASTAARSASARFIPATRITARVSNSIRLAEIASHFASQEITTAVFPARNAGCSSPVLPTKPVFETGVIPEEPVVTPSEAAGSGVSCGSVLADADACGVAFRVAMDAHVNLVSADVEFPATSMRRGLIETARQRPRFTRPARMLLLQSHSARRTLAEVPLAVCFCADQLRDLRVGMTPDGCWTPPAHCGDTFIVAASLSGLRLLRSTGGSGFCQPRGAFTTTTGWPVLS